MNVSLSQAAAALNANSRWQEVIAENLATSSIPGARRQELSFSSVEAGMASGAAGASGLHYLMPAAKGGINFQQGVMRPTGTSTDFAIEGTAFFEVQLPNGSKAYTRDGEFHLNAQGQLVTKQGYLVMSDGGPLQFDSSNASPISVAPTGEVSQGADTKGRLRLAEFTDPHQLSLIGDGFFVADSARPIDSTASRVKQGYLEGSNTSPTTEMAGLITAMRMFEANQRVLQTQDERMGRVISDLGNPS